MATIVAALQRLSSPPTLTLRTLQPTHTTVSYTVSTRRAATTATTATTAPARLRFFVGIALRLLVGLAVVLLLWAKSSIGCSPLTAALSRILGTVRADDVLGLVARMPWRYLLPASACASYLALRRGYTEESLVVLRGLGLQTSTTSSIYLRTPTTRFIPTTSVQDIFLYEAFKGFEIRFYLAVVVKGEEDVVVVFPRLLPRRAVLEEVWRGSRRCLWEDMGSGGRKGQGSKEGENT